MTIRTKGSLKPPQCEPFIDEIIQKEAKGKATKGDYQVDSEDFFWTIDCIKRLRAAPFWKI